MSIATQHSQAKQTNTDNPIKTKVEMKKIDIVIAGTTYTINCPASEKDELHQAERFINNFINDIRKNSPTLPHENLLVLCCLNLYERMTNLQKVNNTERLEEEKMLALINKINQDATSILPK